MKRLREASICGLHADRRADVQDEKVHAPTRQGREHACVVDLNEHGLTVVRTVATHASTIHHHHHHQSSSRVNKLDRSTCASKQRIRLVCRLVDLRSTYY